MKKIAITLTIGTIMIASAVAAFFMENITKDVLAGALISIILPCALVVAYFDHERKSEAVEKRKQNILPVKKEVASAPEIEVYSQMSERPAAKKERSYIVSL
jgi:uncharacterized membrane protein